MHPIKSISQCLIVVKEKQLFSQVTKVKPFIMGIRTHFYYCIIFPFFMYKIIIKTPQSCKFILGTVLHAKQTLHISTPGL